VPAQPLGAGPAPPSPAAPDQLADALNIHQGTPPHHRENDVRLRLRPRDDSYYEMFTDSANNLVIAARLLVELMSDGADREAITEKMRACEHAGDDATHAIMRRLNKSSGTPIHREDIYRLASNLDDVMDSMEAAVDLIGLYGLERLPKGIIDQIEVLERAAELTAEAMPRLRTLEDLTRYWIEINQLENQADRIYRKLLARLFSGEYDALTVLKLKDVIEELETAADAFEHVANTVETIVVKNG
jgi:predicted phosphate transport protein (TIGR00153 family)